MKKVHHLHIELTPEQYQELSTKAKACGLSKRMFLVRHIENTPVQPSRLGDIKALRTEVHKIGNNINQIARGVNTNTATAEDIAHSRYLMEQVYRLMYEIGKP